MVAEDETCTEFALEYALGRILIVDDSPDAAEYLSVLLGLWGYDVMTARDGHSALTSILMHRPDVVLMDIGLPVMSGYEVAKQIRANSNLPRITLIALTGYGREEDKAMALNAGFDAHFVKPIHPEVLKQFLLDSHIQEAVKAESPRPSDEIILH